MNISSLEKRGLTLKFLKSYKILNSNLENILNCRFEHITFVPFYVLSIIFRFQASAGRQRPRRPGLGCPYFRPCPRFRATSRDRILDIFKD